MSRGFLRSFLENMNSSSFGYRIYDIGTSVSYINYVKAFGRYLPTYKTHPLSEYAAVSFF